MGQQQLLLIVLGVIIVGVAVVLGIQYFSVGAEESAKDELVSHNLTIGANAQQWYRKPEAMGGGGNSFDGFVAHFDANLNKLKYSTSGTYGVSGTGPVTITGTPVETGYTWKVITQVQADTMITTVTPNP